MMKVVDFSQFLESAQAEMGQPAIPDYTHITLPLTNQRIEGPIRTKGSVELLLKRIIAKQRTIQKENEGSQKDARNEAANVLFNHTDELKSLGWMII